MDKTVLVVDDEPSILEVVNILLSSEGYTVLTASNGEEGLQKIREHKPDIVIMDVMMPKMSGFMVTKVVQKDPELKDIPILLLTATSQMAGGIQLEMPTPYRLTKPFQPEELIKKIKTILKKHDQQKNAKKASETPKPD